MTDTVLAPWDDATVASLNRWQTTDTFYHRPYTCGVDSAHGWGRLLATRDGWVCTEPGCDYVQNWATMPSTPSIQELVAQIHAAYHVKPAPAPAAVDAPVVKVEPGERVRLLRREARAFGAASLNGDTDRIAAHLAVIVSAAYLAAIQHGIDLDAAIRDSAATLGRELI